MSTKINVRPVVPLAGGATGIALARMNGKSAGDTFLYGLLGAGLAWAGAAAVILNTAVKETQLTQVQANQLAGFIADRERQAATLPSSPTTTYPLAELDRQRICCEIMYLKNVLTKANYSYQAGKAVKLENP